MRRYGNLRRLIVLALAAGMLVIASDARDRPTLNLAGGRFIRTPSPSILRRIASTPSIKRETECCRSVLTGKRTSIAVGRQPNAVSIDPATNRIYVVNAGGGNVSVIDGSADRVIATIPTDTRPYAIGIDAALHRVYVTNTFSDKVTVIDGTTKTAKQLPLGSKDFVETDTRRHRAFFISYEDPKLT